MKIARLTALGLLVAGVLSGCVKSPEEQELRKSQDKVEIVLEGVIEPCREAKVVAPLSERLKSVSVKNGARVRINQVLAQYDATEQLHAYRKAQLDYERTTLPARSVSSPPVVNREALANAKERVVTTYELYRQDKASLAEVRSAEDAYLNLSRGAQDLERAHRQEELQAARSQGEAAKDVQRARLELEKVRQGLDRGSIVAPVSGYLTSFKAYPGQSTSQGEVLGTIMDIDAVTLKGSFSPGIYPYLKKGMPLEVSCLTTPPFKTAAAVREITPFIDAQTKRMTLEIPLKNDKYLLQPGDKCVINIVLSTREAAAAGLAADEKKVVIRSETR